MTEPPETLRQALTLDAFPRSNQYDPAWVLANLMGPNVLWLTEALTDVMALAPGSRVLDMGCGKALSSIFLAREFGLQVWATDLWISASDNWQRIVDADVADNVYPIHAEAHTLPYADHFFDAAVSLDAYHYFGTDELYLGHFSRLVRPGGVIGIVVPGLRQEFDGPVPAHLAPYWEAEFWSLHSPAWWRHHWAKSDLVEDVQADFLPDGWRQWRRWLQVSAAHGYHDSPDELAMIEADQGRYLGFTRLVARKKDV